MGFEDCEDLEATQMLELTEEDLDEQTSKPIPLKYVKFQRVTSITVFVEDNYGGDITELGMLKFFGRLVGTYIMLYYYFFKTYILQSCILTLSWCNT